MRRLPFPNTLQTKCPTNSRIFRALLSKVAQHPPLPSPVPQLHHRVPFVFKASNSFLGDFKENLKHALEVPQEQIQNSNHFPNDANADPRRIWMKAFFLLLTILSTGSEEIYDVFVFSNHLHHLHL